MISRALITLSLILGLSALKCTKLSKEDSPFDVAGEGGMINFSYRTTGTGTSKQIVGDVVLKNDLGKDLFYIELTVELGDSADKAALSLVIVNFTPCVDLELFFGPHCSLSAAPPGERPVLDNCRFEFTPSFDGSQILEFEEDEDFLTFFVNKEKLGKMTRPKLQCSSDFYEEIKLISGTSRLYGCN